MIDGVVGIRRLGRSRDAIISIETQERMLSMLDTPLEFDNYIIELELFISKPRVHCFQCGSLKHKSCKEKRCYRCGETGHLASACNKPVKCVNCGESHGFRQCKQYKKVMRSAFDAKKKSYKDALIPKKPVIRQRRRSSMTSMSMDELKANVEPTNKITFGRTS